MKRVVLFGPWIGELGWELMTWQSWCRKKAKNYDKAYVCSFPDMKPVYEDFATFIPHGYKTRHFRMHRRFLERVNYQRPDDVTDYIAPFIRYETDGEFIKYGNPNAKYRYLIHARNKKDEKADRNYPVNLWEELVINLQGTVASIGTGKDYHITGTDDLKGISLDKLMDYMAGCELVIGGSSGIMHLACLCGAKRIVWHGSGNFIGGRDGINRYRDVWNPFQTKTVIISGWKPNPLEVVNEIKKTES